MEENWDELLKEHEPSENNIAKPAPRSGGMSKITYYALLIIFGAAFLLGGVFLLGYYMETKTAEQTYSELDKLYQSGLQATTPTTQPGTTGTGPVETQPPTILPELEKIYELNNDLVGYLHFDYPNLNLRFPVVQSSTSDDFYLDYDFYGRENMSGCPYVPNHCDVFKPSDSVVIYGHNMQSGGMFNKLTWYRKKSYWQEHQTFHFDTLYERHTYRIFAVFKTAAMQHDADGNPWGYPYHYMNNFQNEEEFNKFIADVKGAAFTGTNAYKGESYYDTGITPVYGDKILCLSTCEYSMTDPDGTVNGRLVVMAVRIE